MKKLCLFFIIFLSLSYLLITSLSRMLYRDHHAAVAYETVIMHESVKERFDLYLNSSHIVAVLSAKIFANQNAIQEDYASLGKTVTEKFHEILGFNLLDVNGKIIRVYPPADNKEAFQKVSQNASAIFASAEKGSSYWFSPPFDLYQGEIGFAFYVPIYKNKKLIGWVAPMLSNRLFFERFQPSKFLTKYNLVIKDVETGKNYFETASLPASDTQDYLKNVSTIFGREIAFYSWPIHPGFNYKLPWYSCFFVALIFSLFATYTFRLFDQRKETRDQLKKIKALIDFTAKEASTSLAGIYKELNLMGKETGYVSTDKVSKYVSYISNLLDQISISDRISHPNRMLEFQNNQVYPLLKEQIELFSDRLGDKNIRVKIDESHLRHHFEVWCNKWLLCHSVLGNIMRNILYYAPVDSDIKVTFLENENHKLISFYHSAGPSTNRDELHDEILDRCLSIAREVVKISNGEIDVIERPEIGRTIVLKFSK